MKAYNMTAFGDWLEEQMRDRGMSARQFADLVDVAPSTITRSIDKEHPYKPGMRFIRKLASATGVPVSVLAELANPDLTAEAAERAKSRADAQLLAYLIEQLPENERKAVKRFVSGFGNSQGQD